MTEHLQFFISRRIFAQPVRYLFQRFFARHTTRHYAFCINLQRSNLSFPKRSALRSAALLNIVNDGLKFTVWCGFWFQTHHFWYEGLWSWLGPGKTAQSEDPRGSCIERAHRNNDDKGYSDFMTLTFCSKFLDQKSVQLEDLESGWLLTSILLYTLNMMNLMLVKSKKVSRAERLQWSENWNLKGASLSFFNFQETSRESSGQLEQGGPDKHKQRAAGRHRFKLMTGESWNVSDDKYDSSFSVLEKLH